jgi:copper transport protein
VPRTPIARLIASRVAHRAGLSAVIGLFLLMSAPYRVSAHAELAGATPAPNGTVVTSPDIIELRFSEPVDADLVFIDLVDASRRPVDGLGAATLAGDGTRVEVTVPDLEPGVYTVTYQVVSAVDGHATTGAYAFVVDPTGTEASPATPPEASAPAVDGRSIAARWVGLLGGLMTLGGLVVWWRSRSLLPEGAGGPPWPFLAATAAVAYLGLAAYLWLASRPIVEAIPARGAGLPLDFAAPFGSTAFAVAMRIALAASLLTALVGVVAAVAPGRVRGRVPALVAVILAAIALLGMSMAAHAAAAGGIGFGLVDWAHLVGVAAWLGGLPVILLLARRSRGTSGGWPAAGGLLRRHGSLALVAAPLVVLTGIANSPLVLGSARDLVGSEYGNLLLAKAGLLSVALAIGAVNHFALRGRGRAHVAALVGIELVVAAVAVSAAATMVTIQPAAARQPTLGGVPVAPAHLFGETGPVSIHATVELPTPGTQRYLLTIADARTGAPRDDVQLAFLELTPPAETGLPPERVDLEPDADRPGLHTAEGAYLSVAGDWRLDVVVRRRGALDERASFVVPVQEPVPPQLVPPEDTGIGVPAPLAVLWTVLPAGPAGWITPLAAFLVLVLVGWWAPRARMTGRPTVAVLRGALVAVVVVATLAVGSRALVAAANAPTAEDLAEHRPEPGFVPSGAEGEAIYRANCASCHGIDGDGDGPVRTLPPPGPLGQAIGRMSSAELSYRIANGLAATPMPAFAATLTESERWHLVHYLEERWRRP